MNITNNEFIVLNNISDNGFENYHVITNSTPISRIGSENELLNNTTNKSIVNFKVILILLYL
jgi:hypothetical protein